MSWPAESIPDADAMFMRVHRVFVPDGELAPGVFRDHGEGMSTDWERYASPEQTRARAKRPEDNGVISLRAGDVRSIELRVEHAPLDENRAHTDVVGEKTTEARLKLLRVARWAIPVSSSERTTPSTTGSDQ